MDEPKHVRRPRYKGSHPKEYKEKYKELNPDKYAGEVTRIMEQGRTPAGMHRPICVQEIMDFLQVQPGQTGVDATLGYGGHSLEILQRLTPGGKLYSLDVDPIELPLTTERIRAKGFGEDIFYPRNINFSQIDQIVGETGRLDFVLADLGVSSMQIDNPERGFSFKVDGPLDLRLNPEKGIPASQFLKTVSQEELEDLLLENSDETFSAEIADAIKKALNDGNQVTGTNQLRKIITDALNKAGHENKEEIKKSCQRTFQALRIAVNNEFEALEQFIDKLPDCLVSGGRVAILTFHSGEDRRVKKAFRYFHREGIFSDVAQSPVRPSPEECVSNPRAKSAKLRWAVRS